VASLEQRREVTAGSSTYGDAGSAVRRNSDGRVACTDYELPRSHSASGRAASGSTARLGKARATSGGAGREGRGRAARDVAARSTLCSS
jgi:hypothetical protein